MLKYIPKYIEFFKMTGAGNDFILIDNRLGIYSIDWSQLAPKICNRRYSVGADGLLIIEKSKIADFKLSYFNSDGSYGGMCGNGGRCAALFLINETNRSETRFEALDYIYTASKIDLNVKLKLKKPNHFRHNELIEIFDEKISANFVDMGAPHVVIFINNLPNKFKEEIYAIGINRLGKSIRWHELFQPEGTNVNFVEIIDNKTISMRTYERGVEDETLACGTGSAACAIVTSLLYGYNSPINVTTHSKEILRIDFKKENKDITDVELTGSAKIVFSGRYPV